MSAEKDDELKSFQIGLRSGTGSVTKKAPSEHFEITKEDYPNLSAANRIKATFKRKTGEKLQEYKDTMKSEEKSSDEREAAEKAKRAWELALEVVSQLSVKD
jgi:hypothetical protein